MSGSYEIEAPNTTVWQALNDVNMLKLCIPGCEEIKKNSETELEAIVIAKVGPVKAKFKGIVRLSDIQPPKSYTISGEGKGGAAGFAKGEAKVELNTIPMGTILSYTVSANVGGKLAQIGGRLIDSTAKKLADQFFSELSDQLSENNEKNFDEEKKDIRNQSFIGQFISLCSQIFHPFVNLIGKIKNIFKN
jgi:hypothetical protein